MALLWCDGFDHYGVIGNLTEGVWAEVGTQQSLSTANPRTGTHNIRCGNATPGGRFRRVLGGAKTSVGVAAAFYLSNLPTGNNRFAFFCFRDAGNAAQITISLQTTGIIEVLRGDFASGVSLGDSVTPAITAEAYQHVEAFVFFSQTVGTVEVRVNGVTVVSLSGVDTVNTSLVECSQINFFTSATAGASSNITVTAADMDDLFAYDDLGSFNNTFIGDRRVITLFPNANTAQADWTAVGAASGYEAIDEASPDGDTSYITAGVPGSPGPISEFGFQDLPAGVSAVSAVVIVEMARKTEAGVANTQWSVVSGSSEAAGADKPMTEIYTYRQDVFEVDPATAAPFTMAAVDAILGKVERTA